jgi:hypothetical protein
LARYIFGIDPGTDYSAYALLEIKTHRIISIGKIENYEMRGLLQSQPDKGNTVLLIEEIKGYGNAVGDTTLQTCIWVGRFIECWGADEVIELLPRKTVVTQLCLNPRAKDSNIRQRMINKYGHPGTKKAPGVLYGVTKDMWQALGLSVAWIEIQELNQVISDTLLA